MNLIRSLRATACAALVMLGLVRAEPPGGTAGWTLSFEDNFDGTSVNTTRWNVPARQDALPWGYLTPANAVVANGILTQVISRRDASTYHFAELDTRGLFEPVYGYIEARVKTSWAPSVWPSFWMVSPHGWPPELDIYENWGGSNAPMSSQNWHFRNSSGAEEGDAKGVWLPTGHPDYWGAGWGADYHVYAAHWQEGRIDFYIDGVLTHTSTKEVTSLPMYVILSNGLGGAEHGNPDFSEGPADKYNSKVDYVRVWTRPLGAEVSRSGWSATASSSGPWNPPANAIDGDPLTRWGSGQAQVNGQWFQVDMGSARAFDTVVLKSYQNTGDAPAAVQLFVSDNPSSWGAAVASKTDDATIQELNTLILKFPAQTKRYLRVVQTGAKPKWWAIDDLHVYSSAGTAGSGGGSAGLVADGTYRMINRNSGRSLAVSAGSLSAGAQIIQWDYTGADEFRWTFTHLGSNVYHIVNVRSGQRMDIHGASLADGAANIQWPAHGGANQRWVIEDAGAGYRRIRNQNSGKVLDIEGAAAGNGARNIQWSSHGGWNQQWSLAAP